MRAAETFAQETHAPGTATGFGDGALGTHSEGVLRLGLKRRGPHTVLDGLYQSGCMKARLLRPEPGHCTEAVLLNTAGGLTGGDRLSLAIGWQAGTHAAVTTQACEKIYRAAQGVAHVATVLHAAPGATAEWLPQETILFDRCALRRDLQVRLGVGAVFTGVESLIIGRPAMGETVRRVQLRDGWRIWRGSRLIYADVLTLRGDIPELLGRAFTAQGRDAFASLLHVGPRAEAMLESVRGLLANCGCTAAASAWNGLLAVRFVAAGSAALRCAVVRVLQFLRQDMALPRVWQS